MKSEQIKEITDKAADQLIAALNAGRSEALTGYLKAIGRFHRYSLHNVLLIASQKPNASYVAGFRTWKQLGRFVKKGEKGILILAPIVRRNAENDEEHEESTSIAGFRAAYVFDVSQTDGKELPQIAIVQGDPRQYGERLRTFAHAQGISVQYSSEIAPARGTSTAVALRCFPASCRRKSSPRWRTNWRMSSCIAAIAGAAPRGESAKPKRRRPRSWFATLSGSTQVRPRATTFSCGTEMPSSLPRALAMCGKRLRKCSPRSRIRER
jgi:hypothetical protein